MTLQNLNNFHLTDAEREEIKNAIVLLEQTLKKKQINLTAEERKRFGSVNEQNKLFINKVALFAKNQPNLCSSDINWEEFFADRESRDFIEKMLMRLEILVTTLRNAKILHDYDNYQDALKDYSYTTYKAEVATGYEVKLKELKQFFSRERKKK